MRQADWLERWHQALERHDRTADVAALRLLSWCALVLVVTWACALAH